MYMGDWTDDIEEILSKVRQNCIDMYKYHLCRYFQYKRVLPLFRVPVLVLNAFNSVFSVGLQPYMKQELISVLNCMISLIAALINSIEMYMGIQKSMESEMSSSQGFYILSIGIYKMLTLKRANRDISAKQYLTECYNTYSELVRNSKLIKDPYMLQKDFLQSVDGIPDINGFGGIGGMDAVDGLVEKPFKSAVEDKLEDIDTMIKNMEVATVGSLNGITQKKLMVSGMGGIDDVERGSERGNDYIVQSLPSHSRHPGHHHGHHHYNNYNHANHSPAHSSHHSSHHSGHRMSGMGGKDPLDELTYGLFGTQKKSSFLEMAGVHMAPETTPEPDTVLGSLKGVFGSSTKRPSFHLDGGHLYSQHGMGLVGRQPSMERNVDRNSSRYIASFGGVVDDFSTKLNNGKHMIDQSVDRTMERTRHVVDDVATGMGATMENIASIVEETENNIKEEYKDIIPENEGSV